MKEATKQNRKAGCDNLESGNDSPPKKQKIKSKPGEPQRMESKRYLTTSGKNLNEAIKDFSPELQEKVKASYDLQRDIQKLMSKYEKRTMKPYNFCSGLVAAAFSMAMNNSGGNACEAKMACIEMIDHVLGVMIEANKDRKE